jgi:hypothetical protein
MKRLTLLISLLFFSVQFLTCNSNNPWENDNSTSDVSSVEATSNTNVEVVFTSEVDNTALTAGNYSIKDPGNTALAITAAARGTDNKTILLTTASQSNVEYNLVVNGVMTVASGNSKSRTINTTNNPNKFTGDGPFVVENVIRDSSTSVTINFSKDVDAASAGIMANYSISPTLGISSATVSGKMVSLVTDAQTDDILYTVTVSSSVLDSEGNTILPTNNSGTFGIITFPQLISATRQANRIVDLVFSENVNISGAAFSISDGLALSTPFPSLIDSRTVRIVTDYQTEGIVYTVTASITDVSGNAIDPAHNMAIFTGNASPWVSNVEIATVILTVHFSEIMLNDNTGDGANNVSNYQLYDSALNNITSYISTAWFDGSDNSIVYIGLSFSLLAGNYTLVVNPNVEDTNGYSMRLSPTGMDNSFTFSK